MFPFDTEKEFATKGKVPVKATVGGAPYTGSLMTCRESQHMLAVVKAIRKETGKRPGDVIEVEVWRGLSPRELEIPAGLEEALKKEGLMALFEELSATHRKEYCCWVLEAKKEETRAMRLEKAVEMIPNGEKTPG